MMDQTFDRRVQALRAWTRGDQRAVHKPLLVLYAIGYARRSAERLIPFRQINTELASLLKEFGPPRRSTHTEYPFWRLQNDGIWEVTRAESLLQRASNNDPLKSELLSNDIRGGFLPDFFAQLRRSAKTQSRIAQGLLRAHFPNTMHADILAAVGLLDGPSAFNADTRSQEFRKEILRVYNYRCCVCGYDLRLGGHSIGLEAAHIKWFQAGGPDVVENGLSLCILHHKLFDLGAFTIDPDQSIILCSQELSDSSRSDWMLAFHRLKLAAPQHCDYAPKSEYLAWHRAQVFRSPERR